MRVLTIKQPWADLIMAGGKDVENRTWSVPATLPQWGYCRKCDQRQAPGTWEKYRHVGHVHAVPAVTVDGPFPFRLWVHAAKKSEHPSGWPHEVWDLAALDLPAPRTGALLGSVAVTGCHRAEDCYPVGHQVDACTCAGPFGMGVGSMHEPGCGLEPWCSEWAQPDAWHWTLADPDPLPVPVPARGHLGLWTLPDDVAVQA